MKLFCKYYRTKENKGYTVPSSYTRENAYHDVFVSGYHNNRYVTFWTDGENDKDDYRYQFEDYFSLPSFC